MKLLLSWDAVTDMRNRFAYIMRKFNTLYVV